MRLPHIQAIRVDYVVVLILVTLLGFLQPLYATPKVVGFSLPLTGKLGTYGEAFRNGLQLMEEEWPDITTQVKFLLDDSQYDGAKVASSIKKLINKDHVDILYVWGITPSQVAAPIAQQAGVPLVAMTTDPVSDGRSLVASLQLPLESLQLALSRFIIERKFKTTGVIFTDFGGATRFMNLLRPTLPGLSYFETVPTDSQDFRSLVARIREKPVDALILMVLPEQTLPLAHQLAAQRVRAHTIGGDTFADDTLRRELSAIMGDVSYVYGAVDEDFKRRYQVRYGNTSHLYEAAAGYSAGVIMGQIVRSLDKVKNTDLILSLHGARYETPIGEITFMPSVSTKMESTSVNPTTLTPERAKATSGDSGIRALLSARVYTATVQK